jgi:flagellar hook-associated protein 3 FlgL
MTRIATSMISENAMADIAKAQRQMVETQRQAASGTVATDVQGYGRAAQTLVNGTALIAKADANIAIAQEMKSRLSLQDTMIGRAADATQGLRQSLVEALALNDASGVFEAAETAFNEIRVSFNMSLGGRFLFAGAQDQAAPVTATDLTDLAANPLTDAVEQQTWERQVRLDDHVTINSAPLARDVTANALASLQRLAQFNAGPNGPFTSPLTAAQTTILQDELAALDLAFNDLLSAQGNNGRAQKAVEDSVSSQERYKNTLQAAMGGISDVDLAEVAVRLNDAQVQYEATARMFSTLRSMTLLDFLQ